MGSGTEVQRAGEAQETGIMRHEESWRSHVQTLHMFKALGSSRNIYSPGGSHRNYSSAGLHLFRGQPSAPSAHRMIVSVWQERDRACLLESKMGEGAGRSADAEGERLAHRDGGRWFWGRAGREKLFLTDSGEFFLSWKEVWKNGELEWTISLKDTYYVKKNLRLNTAKNPRPKCESLVWTWF